MKLELDPNPSDPVSLDDFSDAVSLTVVAAVPLAPNAAALAIVPPEAKAEDLAVSLLDAPTLDAFKRDRDTFVKHYTGMVINSPADLEEAGKAIDICIATKKQIGIALKNAKDYYFRAHRGFTGLENELSSPLDVLEQAFRSGSTAYRLKVQEEERRARQEADRQARLRAEAAAAEERAAAARAAAEAAEAAAVAKAIAAAAAAAGDLDAAMEAEAHAHSAETHAVAAATEAEAVAAAPVYVPPAVMPEPVLARNAGGSTLVDKWVAEVEDTEAVTIKAIVAACVERPELVSLLALDWQAIQNLVGRSLKEEARIPGMRIVNKPIDRRLGARGKR